MAIPEIPERRDGAERRSDEPDPIAVGFVLQLARALHAHGYSAQRLENILGATSDRLGLHGHRFFSMPTQIMHQKVLDKLQDAAKSTTDTTVAAGLAKSTAKVQEHLTKAQSIQAGLK